MDDIFDKMELKENEAISINKLQDFIKASKHEFLFMNSFQDGNVKLYAEYQMSVYRVCSSKNTVKTIFYFAQLHSSWKWKTCFQGKIFVFFFVGSYFWTVVVGP